VHAANDDLRLLAELCDEAVARHGADISRIERYVAEALTRLPQDKRQLLQDALTRFLSMQSAFAGGKVRSSH
jgi:hypothetical protein